MDVNPNQNPIYFVGTGSPTTDDATGIEYHDASAYETLSVQLGGLPAQTINLQDIVEFFYVYKHGAHYNHDPTSRVEMAWLSERRK